eukprot:m51a1_g17 hypothetical protein (430) ;mRNA; r:84064-85439
MCGRSACALSPDEILLRSKAAAFDRSERYRPSYNVRPRDYQPVLLRAASAAPRCALATMRWGMERSGRVVINARAEGLGKAAWRSYSGSTCRCAVVTQGFFEWNAKGRPYFLRPKDPLKLLLLAGLYDPKEQTYVIVTRPVTDDLAWLHERMPVILGGDDDVERWLDGRPLGAAEDDGKEGEALLPPGARSLSAASDVLEWYEVGDAVNSSATSSECVRPLSEIRKTRGLDRFFGGSEVKEDPAAAAREEDPAALEGIRMLQAMRTLSGIKAEAQAQAARARAKTEAVRARIAMAEAEDQAQRAQMDRAEVEAQAAVRADIVRAVEAARAQAAKAEAEAHAARAQAVKAEAGTAAQPSPAASMVATARAVILPVPLVLKAQAMPAGSPPGSPFKVPTGSPTRGSPKRASPPIALTTAPIAEPLSKRPRL